MSCSPRHGTSRLGFGRPQPCATSEDVTPLRDEDTRVGFWRSPVSDTLIHGPQMSFVENCVRSQIWRWETMLPVADRKSELRIIL
jgi:hypothetical protein